MATDITGQLWVPANEEAVTAALAQGTFAESHWTDAKAITGDTDGERKETARDIASFANDGGVLVIGVAEDKKAGTFHAAPVPLANAVEKLEQIALTRLQPPLAVRIREIRTVADPSVGYLAVVIPASPDAPHQVDGRYYGRGERTRHFLSDEEVRRMLAARAQREEDLIERLDELRSQDHAEGRATLYFVARPIGAPREMAVSLVREANRQRIVRITQEAAARLPQPGYGQRRLSVVDAYQAAHVQRGIGLASNELEGQLPDVEVHHFESGALEVIFRGVITDQRSTRRIEDQSLAFWMAEAVALLAGVAAECEFRGSWLVSVLISRLQKAAAISAQTGYPPSYQGADYTESIRVDAIGLQEQQGVLVRALLAPLFRDLEVDTRVSLPNPDGTWKS